jgi:hypothetical protein
MDLRSGALQPPHDSLLLLIRLSAEPEWQWPIRGAILSLFGAFESISFTVVGIVLQGKRFEIE